MKRFELIVFDLDGTLFDTKRSILKSIKYMIDTCGLRRLPDEQIRAFLGPPLEASMKRFYPEYSEEEILTYIETYRKFYIEKELFDTELYPDMLDVLKTLKKEGYKIALATYKVLRCVTPLFEHFDITRYFDTIRGSIEGKEYSKVDIINMAIKDCEVHDLRKVCMIGDTEHDFRGAIQCGINFIGMTYGFGYTGMDEKELKYKEFLGYCDKAIEILDKLR